MGGQVRRCRAHIQKHKWSIVVLGVFVALGIGVKVNEYVSQSENSSRIERDDMDGEIQSQTFQYHADNGLEGEITMDVSPTMRSEKEAQDLLSEAVAAWEKQYLGKNKTENQILYDLVLPDVLCDGLVRVSYESSDISVLDVDGTVITEQIPTEGVLVKLQAEFAYETYSRVESRWIKLVQPEKNSEEWLQQRILEETKLAETNSEEQKWFSLPKQVEGYSLTWSSDSDSQWVLLILLGVVAAFCIERKDRESAKKAAQKKRQHLETEYPLLVEQMALLLGSGMTILSGWRTILKMNRRIQQETGKKRLFAEEMWITYQEIQQGCGEKEAYERFGMRIGLIPYRRFSSILSQNLSKGTKDVKELLAEESREAFEHRKNRARRLGEEASTKLIFPMLLMFLLILMVLLVPAIQQF